MLVNTDVSNNDAMTSINTATSQWIAPKLSGSLKLDVLAFPTKCPTAH